MTTLATPLSFTGVGVCAGICLGRVQIIDRRRLAVPRYRLRPGRVEAELDRFEHAVTASENQIIELKDRAARTSMREVESLLEAHATILRDRVLHEASRETIRAEQINAEWALTIVVRKIREMFDGLEQGYFRERRSDVEVVGDRLLRNLVGAETELVRNIPPEAVVVAHDLSPADTVALARYSVKGFVTETGARTSHIAIFARSMGIPAVVGVHGIVERAGTGDRVVVDGATGTVVLRPSAAEQTRFRAAERRRQKAEAALLADRHLPAETRDHVPVELLGNIEVPEELDAVLANGGQGIGLYRTEFLVIERRRFPTEEEHLKEYTELLGRMRGLPVTLRTIDIGGDKFVQESEPRLGRARGENPALGLRAIRYSLREPATFKAQLRAALIASAIGPLKLLLPLITSVEELRAAREIVERLRVELQEADVAIADHVPLGVMIETPAAVMMADALARECDFFSVGTNDLIQYALAVDRRNDDVSYLYQPAAPSVLRMLEVVARAAQQARIDLHVCGEMAADPFCVPLLLGLGFRSLSMSPPAIPIVKRLVRRASVEDCLALVAEALTFATTAEVEAAVGALHDRWGA